MCEPNLGMEGLRGNVLPLPLPTILAAEAFESFEQSRDMRRSRRADFREVSRRYGLQVWLYLAVLGVQIHAWFLRYGRPARCFGLYMQAC